MVIRLGRQPLTILMRLGETQMFPMPKVNVLQTALVTLHYVFYFSGHFPPKHQKKKNVHPSENATLHPISL